MAEAGKRRTEALEQYATTPQGSMAPGATSTFSHPKILAPAAGQRFLERTAIPIKLAPPRGWTVGTYMAELQREEKNGNWVAHTTIPVGADEAQKSGYTGFGAGAPPAFLSVPGAWRLRAQASYPKQSGWSEWVEFTVRAHQVRHKVLKP